MILDYKKTRLLITANTLRDKQIKVTIKEDEIIQVKSHKLLSVIVDEYFNFDKQMNASKRQLIFKFSPLSSKTNLLQLLYSF